jgi:hypothetical protein
MLTDTGAGGEGFPPPVLAPPPHACNEIKDAAPTQATNKTVLLRGCLVPPKQVPSAMTEITSQTNLLTADQRACKAGRFGPVVGMVNTTSVAPLPATTEVGLKTQLLNAGIPEQESEMF